MLDYNEIKDKSIQEAFNTWIDKGCPVIDMSKYIKQKDEKEKVNE